MLLMLRSSGIGERQIGESCESSRTNQQRTESVLPFFVAVTVNLLSHPGRKITGQKHPLGTSERNISAVL